MKTVRGDLLDLAEAGEFDVIVQGCNCHHRMGAGLARGIRERFPEAFGADLGTPMSQRSKLGTFSSAIIKRGMVRFVVVNAYTQFDYTGPNPVDYGAISSCFRRIKREFAGKRIGIPRIGAGLAGGDWERIKDLILAEMGEEDLTLVEFSG